MKVKIIHKETITPSSPTPSHLKTLHLSFMDQLVPEVYVPLLLFYPNPTTHEKSSILKTSLSETLTHFYPLAGKFQYNDSICCDDHGAAFVEARVNCRVSKILENPDAEMLKHLFPAAFESTQALTGHLLLVQVNFFECGGMAIAINISHKVADAFTLSTFTKIWARVAQGHPVLLPADSFGALTYLYPPQDFLNASKPLAEYTQEQCMIRRFVFDASRIAALQFKAASASVTNPTRIEVVSALIWKCAMEASRSNSGSIRPSVCSQPVNMRKRSGKPFVENVLGNFVWFFKAITVEGEVDLQSLVATFRKCMEDFKVNYRNGVSAEQAYQTIKESAKLLEKEGMDSYTCTSWCRFPFYETNFGWGKPSWVSTPYALKNKFYLMDANDGNGIEAYVTLLEEDMAIFGSNQELLAYASLNPSVVY
ncbi:PREDICTED: BAHD acyltransferase At5g47980-like [Fragaria vesca subsp. vesca]